MADTFLTDLMKVVTEQDMAGMIRLVTVKLSKSGQKFAILTLEDFTGSAEALLWGDAFALGCIVFAENLEEVQEVFKIISSIL